MVARSIQHRSVIPFALAVAGALFAAFAMMLSGGKEAGAITNCNVTHDSLDGEEQAFLGMINNYRGANGLGALTISTNLNRGAAWMAQDLADKAYFSHTDSLGRSPYARAIDCGYPAGAGENLAAGTSWSTASSAFAAWQASPGHNANMLGQYYQQIGIARYYNASSPYKWYWATTFGSSNDGTGGGGAGNPTAPNTPTRTPTQPAATSTPTQPAATSTPTQPAATSTPTQFAPTSTPTAPLATSTPTPFGATATPTSPGATSTPTQPAATSTPTQQATNTPTQTSTATPTPPATATPTPPGNSLPLSPGANLVAWGGGNVDPKAAFAGNTSVAVVYEWDPLRGEWKRFFPGLPGFLNNLDSMRQGNAYWIIAKAKSSLQMGW